MRRRVQLRSTFLLPAPRILLPRPQRSRFNLIVRTTNANEAWHFYLKYLSSAAGLAVFVNGGFVS